MLCVLLVMDMSLRLTSGLGMRFHPPSSSSASWSRAAQHSNSDVGLPYQGSPYQGTPKPTRQLSAIVPMQTALEGLSPAPISTIIDLTPSTGCSAWEGCCAAVSEVLQRARLDQHFGVLRDAFDPT